MSNGARMPFEHALKVAESVYAEIVPHCARAKLVGSLRRRKAAVSDIEFIVEPNAIPDGLFGDTKPDVAAIRAVAGYVGEIVKGGERYIQVADVMGSGLTCDLFLVHAPSNWFCQMAIRTGPAALGQLAVTRLHKFGRHHVDGRILVKETGEEWPVNEEADFFTAAGLSCLKPWERDSLRAFTPIEIMTEVQR